MTFIDAESLEGRRGFPFWFVLNAAVAVAYFLSGHLSFLISVSHVVVTPVLFAAEGISLAAAIRFGPRIWPGAFLGQLVLALSRHLSPDAAFAISGINAFEAVIGWAFLHRFRFDARLERLRDILLLQGTVFGVLQPFSATLGCGSLFAFGILPDAKDFPSAWISWWLGNGMGQSQVAVLLLALAARRAQATRWILDLLLAVALLLPVSWLVFMVLPSSGLGVPLVVFAPLLVLLAVTRGLASVAAGGIVLSAFALFASAHGQGPFFHDGELRIVDLNVFVLGVTLTAQLLAVLLEERRNAGAQRLEILRFQESILVSSPIPTAVLGVDHSILQVNDAFSSLLKRRRDELPGTPISDWAVLRDAGFLPLLHEAAHRSGETRDDLTLAKGTPDEKHLDCHLLAVDLRTEKRIVVQMVDQTDRIRMEGRLRDLAFHDSLTGLLNRRFFLDRLGKCLLETRAFAHWGSLFYIDVDHLKEINDGWGHAAGDRYLEEVGRRLKALCDGVATVARVGGDEFVILADHMAKDREWAEQDARLFGQRIRETLSGDYDLGTLSHPGSASVGWRVFTDSEGKNAEEIMKDADRAMYVEKKGRDGRK